MASSRMSIEFKVGLFVIFMTVVTLFLVIYIGVRQDVFSPKVHFYTIAPNKEAVEPGVAVKISAFRIGSVDEVTLHDINSIKIRIKVLKRHTKWFTNGTRVTLGGGFPIGSAYIRVIPGPTKIKLEPGSVLEFYSGEDEMAKLKNEALVILEDVKGIVANVHEITNLLLDPNEDFRRTISNIRQMTESMLSDRGLIYALTDDPTTAAKLRDILEEVLAVAESWEKSSGPIQEDVQVFLKDLDEVALMLQDVAEDLVPASEDIQDGARSFKQASDEIFNATTDLVRLRRKGEYALQLTGELLQRLKESWPFASGDDGEEQPPHPMP